VGGASVAEAARRPAPFNELVAIAGGEEIAVREIIEAFRAPGRNFLTPPRPAPIRGAALIDIGHESLIRQWDDLGLWLRQEISAAEKWRRLADLAERYERGEANLLSGFALARDSAWWDREGPSAAWAKRYGGDFEQTARFLRESRRAEEESRNAEVMARRQKARNRSVAAAAVLILFIIAPLTGFATFMAYQARQESARASVEARVAGEARADAESRRRDAVRAREEANRARASADAERHEADRARRSAESAREEAERARQTAEAHRTEAEGAKLIAEEQRRQALEAVESACRPCADR
jgi:hypothetical protein